MTLTSSSHRHSSSVNASTAPKSCTPTLDTTRSAPPKRVADRRGGGLDAGRVGDVDAEARRRRRRGRRRPRRLGGRPLAVEVEQGDVHARARRTARRGRGRSPDAPPVTTAVGHQPSSGSDEVGVQPGQLRRLDAPLAVGLLVGLVVVAVAVEPHAVGPDRRCRCSAQMPVAVVVRREVDLGHVALVHGDGAVEGLLQERHERVGAARRRRRRPRSCRSRRRR